MAQNVLVTGPQTFSDGNQAQARGGKGGDTIVSELHGRFYEQTYRGNVYSTGIQLTSISNATFTTATGLSGTLATAATATPVVGIWTPATATVNAVILQANLAVIITALQETGCGGFVWAVFSNQAAITVASQATPINHKTLTASGSQVKGLSGLALTGLTSVGSYLTTSAMNGGAASNLATLQTAAGLAPTASSDVENFDGSIIVPPGGILALFCSSTPVAHSALASLTWEEVVL